MSYMALYRKWRPSEFEEVKGQEHIVTALLNQIKANRIGHAYLFCGTRGTGKTTIAKLFAKAVNCEHPVDGSPCNQCPSCITIQNQASMDVIEIDAASNNGVDNIREIREQVQYSPTDGKYKVYIIDEVHMLSIGAFNALLKTLEEPPSYVIFILATTEVHKIPITILSRCQRYDFKRISIHTITERLKDLMEREEIEVEEKALRYVAKVADGSMRDALSLLDQCIAFHLGKAIRYEDVLEILGAVDYEIFSQMLECIIQSDVTSVMKLIEDIVLNGREISQFVTDFIWYLRNLLLMKNASGEEHLEVSKEQQKVMLEMARKIEDSTLIWYIRQLSDLLNQLRYGSQKRVLTEVMLIRLCKPQMETSFDSILERIRALESQIEQGIVVDYKPSMTAEQKTEPQPSFTKEEVEAYIDTKLEPADAETIKQLMNDMPQIKRELTGALKKFLGYAKINLGKDGSSLVFAFKEDQDGTLAKGYLEKERPKQELEEILSRFARKEVHYQCVFENPYQQNYEIENADLNILQGLRIPIVQE